MIRRIFLLLFFITVPLVAADIIVTPLRIDLGDIKWGERKEFSIKVINNSKRPYTITKIMTYCSFLSIDRSIVGKPIKPGEEIEIKGTYRARVIGYFGKVIEIYTNHPRFNKVVVEVTGKVYYPSKLPRLELIPRKVELGILYLGERKKFSVKLKNKGNDILLVSFRGLNQPKSQNFSDTIQIPPGKTVEVAFEFSGAKKGEFNEIIWFSSNDPLNPRLPVVVTGRVVSYGDEVSGGASFKKLAPLFLFLTGFVVIVFAIIRYA